MGCACNKNKKQWQVVAAGGGRVLFTSSSEATAKAVSRRYANSEVREKPKEEPATAKQAQPPGRLLGMPREDDQA